MKTYKQILLGLVSLLIVGYSGLFLLAEKAFAAPIAPASFGNYTLTLTNDTTITMSIAGQTITFVNNGAGNNTTTQYFKQASVPANTLCNTDSFISVDAGKFDRSLSTIQGKVFIHYNSTIGGCQNFGAPNNAIPHDIINPNPLACDPNIDSTCTCSYQGTTFICTKGGTTTPPPTPTGTKTYGISDCITGNKTDPLAWITCSILVTIDNAVKIIYRQVESRLCFPTNYAATNGGLTEGAKIANNQCTGKTLLTKQVEDAWGSMRVIATTLLVIAMLAMVVSQAMGSGVFDAYSVRKMLPKLIAAAILIQLSFLLVEFAINLSNDLGKGLGEILAQPFGGWDAINDIVKPFNDLGAKGQITTAALFVGILVAGVMGGLFGGAIMLMGLAALVALVVGFFVLYLREILILMCVLFVPFAIVAWVLPGTERYWKLWRETFTKLLMMFPMIVGLIVSGRIFASVAVGTGGGFFAVFAILIGFFGPLFLLPKTFSWGGSAMNAMGGAVMKGTSKIRGAPAGAAKSRMADMKGERRRQSADRVLRGEGMNWKRPWRYPADKISSGQMDPTLGGRNSEMRRRKVGAYKAAGLGVEDEGIKAEFAAVEGSIRGMNRGDAIASLAKDFKDTKDVPKRQAILSKLAQLQAGEKLTEIRDELLTTGEGETWNRAVQRNYDALKATSPSLANGASTEMMAANDGKGRTFTAEETAGHFKSQSDQVLAGMSGEGWAILAKADKELARETYDRISTSNQPYAGNMSPDAAKAGRDDNFTPADTGYYGSDARTGSRPTYGSGYSGPVIMTPPAGSSASQPRAEGHVPGTGPLGTAGGAGLSSQDAEKIGHAVESAEMRAGKHTGTISGEVDLHVGETLHPSGVVLTPGGQRDLEVNPPTVPRPNPESPIITPGSPEWKPPNSDNLPK